MANINFEVSGYAEEVVNSIIKRGYAKTRTEAIRLALFEFDKEFGFTEERLFEKAAEKVLSGIESGKEKARRFSLKELD